MEVHDLEERKNEHINLLISNHEKAFSEMRGYYNSVTKDNVSLIRALKVGSVVAIAMIAELHIFHP